MKAIILAAGLGTRLRPLTYTIPKPLITINGEPLLLRIINSLTSAGAHDITINTHHLAEQIDNFVNARSWPIPVRTLYEPQLLETAGALTNAYCYLKGSEPIIVHNGDIYTDINIHTVYHAHTHNNMATLAVRLPPNDRPFLVDEKMRVIGHRNKNIHHEHISTQPVGTITEYNFACVHVVSQAFLKMLLKQKTVGESLTTIYLNLIAQGHTVRAYDTNDALWYDIGTPENIKELEQYLKYQNTKT